MDKVGVFLCTGCGIGQSLAADKLEALARESGAVQVASNPCLCGPEGVASVRAAVEGGAVDGLVLAA